MKNGLFEENGKLIYYKKDVPTHAGVIKVKGDIYYIGPKGHAVKGVHNVHREHCNEILRHGTYTFGDDYKLIPDSYVPPSKPPRQKRSSNRAKGRRAVNWQAIFPLALVVVIVLAFSIWYLAESGGFRKKLSTVSKTDDMEEAGIELPAFEREVVLEPITDATASDNRVGKMVFNYRIPAGNGYLIITEQDDPEVSSSYLLSSSKRKIVIGPLKTGTSYDYSVTVGGKVIQGAFRTTKRLSANY